MRYVCCCCYLSLLLPFTDILPVVTEILQLNMSINLYMFHGGTNFGFMNGAFADDLPAPKPIITSYGMCNESVFD